jgi:SWI/SNF-related matrix-associated actin-dependent regulator of chromatin subfamily A-like protein 1
VKSDKPVLKTINGSRWMPGSKTYRLPVSESTIKLLKKLCPDVILDPKLEAYLVERAPEANPHTDEVISLHAKKFAELYPFQREAVKFLVSRERSMLILEQGLGKTPTSIVAAEYLRGLYQNGKRFLVLIICPKSLIPNWQREIKRWSGRNALNLHRTVPYTQADYSVVNWETFSNNLERYFIRWDLVIIDESVSIKSRRSKRFAASKVLSKAAKRVWLLTGSPTTRYNDDLFTQLQICKPLVFTSYWKFAEQYCIIDKGEWGTRIIGNQPDRDPADDNQDVMFVRSQKQVKPDLPDMIFQTIEVELEARQRRVHDQLLKEFVADLDELTEEKLIAPNVISQLIRLQQATSTLTNLGQHGHPSAKIDALIDIVEGGAKLPLLVWVHWKGTAHEVEARLKDLGLRVGVATGGTDAAQEIENYKSGKYDALVCSLMVGKFGHTLTNTRTVVYIDKTWNADDYVQSVKRVHRIGLEHSPLVLSLVASDSVDQVVEDNLSGKLPGIAKISRQDLQTLMKGIGRWEQKDPESQKMSSKGEWSAEPLKVER